MKKKIDPLIRTLVQQLNEAGYATTSSCQGRTCQEDFDTNQHCDHSFVSFTDQMVLRRRKAKAKKIGLYIYNGDYSISALSGRERSVKSIIRKNLTFSAKMLELFNLAQEEK